MIDFGGLGVCVLLLADVETYVYLGLFASHVPVAKVCPEVCCKVFSVWFQLDTNYKHAGVTAYLF